jgi:hypothetical protein
MSKSEKQKEQNRKWYYAHREEQIFKMKQYRHAMKDAAFQAYGGYVCKCCGETEKSFLCIDHVNNDGYKHRKEIRRAGGVGIYIWLADKDYPSGFQILCFNCNQSKRINGGLCAHQKRKDTTIGHSFEQAGPGDMIMNLHRPEGHAHLDEKLDKGNRTPWLSLLPQEAGLVSPETSEQDGSGHGDTGYSGQGGV